MVLVAVIVVAWVIYLGFRLFRRRMGDGVTSISHFHRQLRVLEHSSPPPIVAPAYRLRAVGGCSEPSVLGTEDGHPPVLTAVGADQLPRPALAFLAGSSLEDSDRVPPETEPSLEPQPGHQGWAHPPAPAPLPEVPVDPYTRELARRRRRDTLGILIAALTVTFVLGFVPGARPAWIVTVVTAVALGAYVLLLVHYRRLAAERSRKLRYLYLEQSPGSGPLRGPSMGTPIGGRYAHPAYQAAVAR